MDTCTRKKTLIGADDRRRPQFQVTLKKNGKHAGEHLEFGSDIYRLGMTRLPCKNTRVSKPPISLLAYQLTSDLA